MTGAAHPRAWAVIPARYASTRFPGKPLARIAGKPMIQHVHERALAAPSVARVIVATDDARIAEGVAAFGGEAVMTGDHPTGTDRIAEAVARLGGDGAGPDAPEWILNVQGDEPMVAPDDLEALVAGLAATDGAEMGTLVYPLAGEAELHDPNVVKAMLDARGRALYFSRSAVPHPRGEGALGWRHMGIYGFRRDFLFTFARLPMTPLAAREQLEQLRALEHGHAIHCFRAATLTVGVDVPGDVPRAEALLTAH